MIGRLTSCLLAAGLLHACGGEGNDGTARTLPFDLVENTSFSAIAAARTIAVGDGTAWASLWAEHTELITPQPERPAIDFSRQMVAAIFLGEVPACNRPRVDEIVESAGSIAVNWTYVPPQPTELCIAAVVHPAQMVRFDNLQRLPVSFRQTR